MALSEGPAQLDLPGDKDLYSEGQLNARGFVKVNETIAFAMFYRKKDGAEIVFKKCGNINIDTCDSYLIVSINYKKMPEVEGIYSMEELTNMGFEVEREITVYTFFVRQYDGCRLVCDNPSVGENVGYRLRQIEFC